MPKVRENRNLAVTCKWMLEHHNGLLHPTTLMSGMSSGALSVDCRVETVQVGTRKGEFLLAALP